MNTQLLIPTDNTYSLASEILKNGGLVAFPTETVYGLGANALDRSHSQKIKGLKTVLKDRELTVVMDSDRDISLELGLLKDKIEFFEEVYGIRLQVRRKRVL